MSVSESRGSAAATKSAHLRRVVPVLVCAMFAFAPLLALAPYVSSDPVDIDNPDYTKTVRWDMDEPSDYILEEATMSGGLVTLPWLTEARTETTEADFAAGSRLNVNISSQPGSMVLASTTTFTGKLVVEPDETTGWDTFISEDRPNDNYGADKDIRLDSEIGRVLRMLVRFDVDSIPSTAVINSAVLRLYEDSGGRGNDVAFTVHALDRSFAEDEATWARASISDFWTTPGGDYRPEVYCSGVFNNTVGWKTLEITTLVEAWARGSLPNNGMIFVPVEAGGDSLKIFASADETGSVQYKPRLEVDYTLQGNEGLYESDVIGPGTNATFTTASWSNGTLSLLNDEFPGTALAARWSWWNDPSLSGGSYNVGVTRPGWMHITGEPNTQNVDSSIGANCVYQEITGYFSLTTSMTELFTSNTMDAGILVIEGNSSWVSISKGDTGLSGKIRVVACEDGASSTRANVPWADMTSAFLRVERNATGIWLLASVDGSDWDVVYQHTPLIDMRQRVKVGLFVTSDSASQPTAQFDFFRVVAPVPPTLQVMVRTGNSSSLSDPSWTDWSGALAGTSGSIDADARYLQYRVYMSTQREWCTPIFHQFTVNWERYASTGSVETMDFTPSDFSMWLTLTAEHDASTGQITYYYSVDQGECWEVATTGTTGSIYSIQPSIRVRADIVNLDTLSTPSIDSVYISYGTALTSFYVEVPSVVTAGEDFEVELWAKNSVNETMSFWVGEVSMQAMNSAGTGPASAELETTSIIVTHAGHATLTTQRYYVAETIRVLVMAGGIVGMSEQVSVLPGPMASIALDPDNLGTVMEGSSVTIDATAEDAYGNVVPGAVFSWTVTTGLGFLSRYSGDSVTFTAGTEYMSGYINVTSGTIVGSLYVTVAGIGHIPSILIPIPDQVVQEDGPTWSIDLGPRVYDANDPDSSLRWFVTNETLVTASNENKTGNLNLVLTPKQNMFGSNTLKLYVVDPQGTYDMIEFRVIIEPVNDGPTIDSIRPLVVRYDVPYIYNLRYYITDIDNDPSELTLSVDAASTSYVDVDDDLLSIIINYPASLLGTTQSVVVTVSDGELDGSTIVVVTVSTDNVPLLLESLPDVYLYQGEAMLDVFDLDDYFMDIDEDVLYYVSGQSNVFVNITNGEVSIYAPLDWAGAEHVIFSAEDPYGARVEDAITVTVLAVNQAPWISGVPDLEVRYDMTYEFDLTRYVGDDDDPIGSLTISTDDGQVAVIGTVLSFLYPATMNGTVVKVNITVSDGELSDWQVISVTISDNTPPESLGPPDHSFTEDWPILYPTSGMLEVWFEDEEDGNDLQFRAFSWSTDVIVSAIQDGLGSWSLRFTTTPDYNGESKVTIRATDSGGALVEETIVLRVVSSPDPPVFSILKIYNATVGVEISFDLSCCVSDPDNEDSQLSIIVPEEWGEYITASATLVRLNFPVGYLSSGESSRTIEVELTVMDPGGLWDTSVMTITVRKPVVVETVPQWGLFLFLLAVGTSVALFGMVMSMRKKPFVIRDMMLVHEDGFLISRHAESKESEGMDEDVFTGMMTAVLNFVEDSMTSTQEHLRFFGFEHYRIMVRRGKKLYAAVIFEGDRPKDIEDKLGEFLKKIEKIYRKSLQHWTGDIEVDFAGAHLMINTFVDENSRKGRGSNGNGLLNKGNNTSGRKEEAEPEEAQERSSETPFTASSESR